MARVNVTAKNIRDRLEADRVEQMSSTDRAPVHPAKQRWAAVICCWPEGPQKATEIAINVLGCFETENELAKWCDNVLIGKYNWSKYTIYRVKVGQFLPYPPPPMVSDKYAESIVQKIMDGQKKRATKVDERFDEHVRQLKQNEEDARKRAAEARLITETEDTKDYIDRETAALRAQGLTREVPHEQHQSVAEAVLQSTTDKEEANLLSASPPRSPQRPLPPVPTAARPPTGGLTAQQARTMRFSMGEPQREPPVMRKGMRLVKMDMGSSTPQLGDP